MLPDPDKEFDAWIDQYFGTDPAAALMQKPKVTTGGFSMDAPPVVKVGPVQSGTGQAQSEAPEAGDDDSDEEPFIDPAKKIVKVTEDNEIDWSEATSNLVEFFDIIQAALFGVIAKADAEERKLFHFDAETIKNLTRLAKPVAQKRNIRVEPEWLLGVMLVEGLVNNGERAWQMRKAKNAAAAQAAAELAAAHAPERAPTLQIIKDETTAR